MIDVLHQESVHRCILGCSSEPILDVEYVTSELFAGPLSVDFTDVQKVTQRFLAICILIFKSKTSIEVKNIFSRTRFFFCFG